MGNLPRVGAMRAGPAIRFPLGRQTAPPPRMGCMRTTRACEECLILGDSPHFRAWRDALRELMDTEWAELLGRTSYSPDKFTEAVHQEGVAGRPRVGVARLGDTEGLVKVGADLAVRSLDEVSRPALAEGRLEGKTLERKVAT